MTRMRNSARGAAIAALAWAVLAGAAEAQPGAPEVRGWVVAPGLPDDARVRVELVPMPSLYEQVVRWLPEREAAPPLAVAGPRADGSFVLAAPGPGLYRLIVRAPGRVPMQRDLAPLVHDLELPPVELPADRRLRVRAVDEAGAAVAGARVSVLRGRGEVWRRRRGWRPLREVVATGADGWATLAAGAGESVVVGAGAAGRLPATLEGVSGAEAAVSLAPALERQVEVRRRGRPVPRAAVWVPAGDRQVAIADERGRAWLTLPAGEASEVWVETPDGWRGRHRVRVAPPPAAAGSDGAPEPPSAGEGFAGAEAGTAAASGDHAVPEPSPDDEPSAGAETSTLPVASAPSLPARLDPRPPLVLAVEPPALFAGRVLAARGGASVAGALVWAAGDEGSAVTADDAGRFALPLVGDASLRLGAAAPGFRAVELAVEPADWPRGGDGLVLSLAEAAAIAGEVVDPAGRPIAAARVLLRSRAAEPGWDPTSDSVMARAADERGRFRFDVGFAGAGVLRAEAPGRAAVERPVGATAEGVRLVLGEGGTLRGRLVAAAPADFAAGQAQLFAEDRRDRVLEDGVRVGGLPVTLAADGGLRAEAIAAGRYELHVRVPGHSPLAHGGIEIGEGGETDLGDLELLREALLAGEVTDDDGRPFAGATVEVHVQQSWEGSSRGRSWREVETDGEGRFDVDGLAADVPVSLIARAPGYAAAVASEVWLPRDEPLILTLAPGATVFGRVVDAGGEPMPDPGVHALPMDDAARGLDVGYPNGFAEVRNDGGFEVGGLPPGPVRLSVFTRDGRRVERRLDALAPGERRGPVIVEVPAAVELVGSVRHADGRPASGAHVWVHPLEASGGDWSGATADAAGRFRLTGTAPGAVRVFARLDSGGHTEAEAIAGDGAQLDLVLAPPTGVSGRVIGPDGAPVPNAMVSLHHEHGSQGRSVDGAGRFEVLDLDPGTYRLSAQAPGSGYAAHPEPIVLAEGTEVRDLVLRLEVGASVAGRVLGLSAGELSRLRVAAWRTGGDLLRVGGVVDGGGAFEIRGLPLGTYRVTATLLDTRRSGEVEVELAADERREGIEIDLSGLQLAFEARLNGRPAPGTLAIAGDATWQRARSLGLGRFLFEGLRPGTYRLGLLPDPGAPWLQQDVEVLGDGEVAIDFAAWPVEGWVVDAAGAPVAGAAIQLASATPNATDFPARHDRAPRTDAGGRFVLPLVPSGSWQLTAVGDDGRRALQPIEVPPGGLGGLTLVLGPPPPPPAPAAPGS